MKFQLKYKFHLLTHWEYYPSWLLYLPISYYFIYLCIRARSFGFFSASNPSIKNGGMGLELKSEIEKIIPARWHPATILIKAKLCDSEVIEIFNRNSFCFPCIAKPDHGCQGKNVAVIHDHTALLVYKRKANYDFLIQQYIDLPYEIGLFYYRYPNDEMGSISGIVEKKNDKHSW